MAQNTTKKINRRVVEALEDAAKYTDAALVQWSQARNRIEDAWDASGLHKDLGDESWAVYNTMSAARGTILTRLRAERDGDE